MKNLLYKELKLVISPGTYFFFICSALLLIPAYPYSVGVSYSIFAILVNFNIARANKDHEFTAMLPVTRKDIVLAKHINVMFTQLMQLLIAIPFALISSLIINTKGNVVGMDANFAFFGFILTAFSIFNIIFLPWYFKTGYKTGTPLAFALTGYLLFEILVEFIIGFVPVLKKNIDSLNPETFKYQIPILIFGIIIYFLFNLISLKISVKNFNKVSL